MGTTLDSFRVLAHEDQAEFDRLLAAYRQEFAPNTAHGIFLTAQLAQSRWRLARARRFEALALDQLLTGEVDQSNPEARIVAALAAKMKDVYSFLQRQATSAETSYQRAHRELTQAPLRELRNKANMARLWLMEQLRAPPPPAPEPQFDPTRATPSAWRPHAAAANGA